MNKLWLLALCVLCLILVAVGQKSSPKAEAVASSRYQLVPAQVDSLSGEKVQHTVFLLDTQTGKVWKYVASGQPKTLKEKDQTSDLSGGSTIVGLTPGTFVPVDRIEFESKVELAHKLQSAHSGHGVYRDRPWREARDGGFFAFQMKVLPGQPQELLVTYWGDDGGNREFEILVDGRKIASQKLTGSHPDEFFDVAYPIPAELVAGKEAVTVRFQSLPGKAAGGAFGCRILRK